MEANGEDCTLLSLAELVHNTESTDDCLFNAYGVFSQLVLFSYCALEGHLQDRSLSPLLQAKVALVLGVCTSLLASRSSDLKVLMRGEGDTAFSLLLGVDASDMQRLADNCTAVIQHFEGRIQEMEEETDEATAILTTVSYCSGFLQAYSDCNS